jgi:hypothetical protein
MAPCLLLLPVRRTLRKSRVNLSDSGSDCETLPALVTTRLEDGAPGAGAHAMSETVATTSSADFGLIGPLHDAYGEADSGYEPPDS